ncbi:MAG: DNA polymerase III subunit alpha [Propionibacteriaceae bacterium]|nr:DNA polymerase III subunit alpha [Propionibacteriaceae bacterium]
MVLKDGAWRPLVPPTPSAVAEETIVEPTSPTVETSAPSGAVWPMEPPAWLLEEEPPPWDDTDDDPLPPVRDRPVLAEDPWDTPVPPPVAPEHRPAPVTAQTPRPTQFTHLHVHSDLSPLDGTASPEKLAREAARLGMTALAITDHGTLGGTYRHAMACRAVGVKPILGIEAYVAIGSRSDPQTVMVRNDESTDADGVVEAGFKRKTYNHLVLLAATQQGWLNLVAIHNASHDTFKTKPLIDLALLHEHNEGVIVLTGCVGGMVAGPLARGDMGQARENLTAILGAARPGAVFIEAMDHGVPAERLALPGLFQLSRETGVPVVATNDVHYLTADDAFPHEVMLAMQSKSTLAVQPPARFAFNGSGYWLRTVDEMLDLFPDTGAGTVTRDDWWQAVANTSLVADMVDDWVLPDPTPHFPTPPPLTTATVWWASAHRVDHTDVVAPPVGVPVVLADCTASLSTPARELLHLCTRGIAARYGDQSGGVRRGVLRTVCERLARELGVIQQMGFVDYFLLVAELVAHARSMGTLVGPGRGSAGGSLVAYLCGIVDVDPLEGGLLFERFLEIGRAGWPDIDLDFERAAVPVLYEHLEQVYGRGTLARCGTLAYERSKRVVKDVCRVHGFSVATGEALAKAIPVESGKPYPLATVMDPLSVSGAEFRRLVAAQPGLDEAIGVAARLEGTSAGVGIHACGVIVSDQPLAQAIPLRRDRESGMWVTEWEYPDLELIGYLKLDMLRLRNLDILHATADTVGVDPKAMARLPDTGSPAWKAAMNVFKHAQLWGVFQMESTGMGEVAMGVSPDALSDVSDIVALYRPGALGTGQNHTYITRKRGLEPVAYDQWTTDPQEQAVLAHVLAPTQGVVLYQEQLMELGRVVSGFDVKERSMLRHAVGKKRKDEMDVVGQMFVSRAFADLGGDPGERQATARRLFDVMKDSASYSFNKSHSWAYATLAVLTAAAKAQWPAAYAAAVLSQTDDPDKRMTALESVRRDGVEVLPPCVNTSGVDTTVASDTSIRFGLSEITGVGKAGRAIVAERDQHGPYTSLADAMARLTTQQVTMGAWKALVCAGAFDAFGARLGHLQALKTRGVGPTDAEWGSVERCAMQRAVLRTSVDRSPLGVHADQMGMWRTPFGSAPITVAAALALDPGDVGVSCVVAGVVGRAALIEYSKGTRFAFTLEGNNAHVDAVMWDSDLRRQEAQGRLPRPGTPVAIEGVLKTRSFDITDTDQDNPDDTTTVTVSTTQITARRMWPILFDDDSAPPRPVDMPWDTDPQPPPPPARVPDQAAAPAPVPPPPVQTPPVDTRRVEDTGEPVDTPPAPVDTPVGAPPPVTAQEPAPVSPVEPVGDTQLVEPTEEIVYNYCGAW